MNLDAFNLSILLPAFLAGLLVLATHVPLGIQVLSRGIVFIDLAIAQIATLGVIAADRAGFEPEGWLAQIAAVTAAKIIQSQHRMPAREKQVRGVTADESGRAGDKNLGHARKLGQPPPMTSTAMRSGNEL